MRFKNDRFLFKLSVYGDEHLRSPCSIASRILIAIGLSLSLATEIGHSQNNNSSKPAAAPTDLVTAGVSISWQATIPPVPMVVSGASPCLELTPDIDKNTYIAANHCNGPVVLLGIRDTSRTFAPFVPTAQTTGRDFATVTVPAYDYAELSGQNIAAYYFVPESIPGLTTATPYLRCVVDPTIGAPLIDCDLSGQGLGDPCSCPAAAGKPGHVVIAPPPGAPPSGPAR